MIERAIKSVFYKAIKHIGEPENNRSTDALLVSMAITNQIRAKYLTPDGQGTRDRDFQDSGQSLFTTNLLPVPEDDIGYNPVICFPVFACTRDTQTYTTTAIYLRNLLAHSMADIISRDLADPVHDPQVKLASRELAMLQDVKNGIKDRSSHPALENLDLSNLDRLSPQSIGLLNELLNVQKRIICYAYSVKSPSEEAQAAYMKADADYASGEAYDFVRKTIVPRITEKKEDGSLSLLNQADLNKAMRMTFLGYSYGGHFIAQVLNAVSQVMDDIGYDQDAVNAGMANIHVHNMQGSNGLDQKHANSQAIVHDKHDFITLSGLSYGSYFPWKLQFRSQRVDPEDRNTVYNGSNSVVIWSEMPKPETLPEGIRKDVEEGRAPKSLVNHFSVIEQPEKLHPMAYNALMRSMLEPGDMPPIAQSLHYSAGSFQPKKIYGSDKRGYPLYLDEVLERISAFPELASQLDAFKDHPEQDKKALNQAVSTLSKAIVVILGQGGMEISRKAASAAAQVALLRAKEEEASVYNERAL